MPVSRRTGKNLKLARQTDSMRAKTLELHIQSRVNSELQKLRDETSRKLAELESTISSQQESKAKEGSTKSAGDALRDLGREAVQNEVSELKKKLAQRKVVKDSDIGVDEAKEKLVKCLRENDRRPLDCWKEVETFKDEVRRLEGQWVEKIVR